VERPDLRKGPAGASGEGRPWSVQRAFPGCGGHALIRYGADRLFDLAERLLVFTLDFADGAEIVITRHHCALTRFSGSRIHQDTACLDGQARVRVVLDAGTAGARVGVATVTSLTPEGLRRGARQALAAARAVPPDPGFGGLAPTGAAFAETTPYDPPTARCPPRRRTDVIGQMLSVLSPGVTGAGAVETAGSELAVVNSLGLHAYHAGSRASVGVLASGEQSTGYAEAATTALDRLDPVALARRADEKVRLGVRPRELPPGTYAVVLEPAAAVVLLHRLAPAFSGRAVIEGRSPLSGHLGEQVCAPAVTIVDDPLSSLVPGIPFDAEGTPKQRLTLIKEGVATAVTYDRATARTAGTAPTGHAVLPPNPLSGMPLHLAMEPGTADMDELVGGVERGLYVTRFHYTNLVHPVRATVTGTTRDGTFLLEDGRIAGGVRNLRFTQSVLGALSGVEAVGRNLEGAFERFYGDAVAPGLRLSSFTFTSTSPH
jgi:PmbA protein